MAGSWKRDPTGRHVYRFHDGTGWTDHVADGGAPGKDPYDAATDGGTPGGADGDTGTAATPDGTSEVGVGGGTAATSPWSAPARQGSAPPPPSPDTAVTAWPSGGTPAVGEGSSSWPGDGASPSTAAAPASGGGGWSTGAKVGAGIAVVALMGLAGVVGFVAGTASTGFADFDGLATDFGAEAELFDDTDRPRPEDVAATGAVLSSDSTTWRGELSDEASIEVSVARSSEVVVEIREAEFDTFVVLYDDTGQVLAEDDDGVPGSLLSRVSLRLEPGTYTLVIDAFGALSDPSGPVEVAASFAPTGDA